MRRTALLVGSFLCVGAAGPVFAGHTTHNVHRIVHNGLEIYEAIEDERDNRRYRRQRRIRRRSTRNLSRAVLRQQHYRDRRSHSNRQDRRRHRAHQRTRCRY